MTDILSRETVSAVITLIGAMMMPWAIYNFIVYLQVRKYGRIVEGVVYWVGWQWGGIPTCRVSFEADGVKKTLQVRNTSRALGSYWPGMHVELMYLAQYQNRVYFRRRLASHVVSFLFLFAGGALLTVAGYVAMQYGLPRFR